MPPLPRVEFRRARPQLAVLHVEVFGEDEFETSVGNYGKAFSLRFKDLINLIKARNGSILMLEHKKKKDCPSGDGSFLAT